METPCRYPSEGHQHGDRKRFETSDFKMYFFKRNYKDYGIHFKTRTVRTENL